MSDTQIVHQLLSQLGIKLEQHWSRSVPNEGEKLGVYQLDQAHWQSTWAVLERRAADAGRSTDWGVEGWITRQNSYLMSVWRI